MFVNLNVFEWKVARYEQGLNSDWLILNKSLVLKTDNISSLEITDSKWYWNSGFALVEIFKTCLEFVFQEGGLFL